MVGAAGTRLNTSTAARERTEAQTGYVIHTVTVFILHTVVTGLCRGCVFWL
jgi:hypothetical protein